MKPRSTGRGVRNSGLCDKAKKSRWRKIVYGGTRCCAGLMYVCMRVGEEMNEMEECGREFEEEEEESETSNWKDEILFCGYDSIEEDR